MLNGARTLKTTPTKESQVPKPMLNSIVMMSNTLARATNNWTVEEYKLFLCAISKVKQRKNSVITLKRREIADLVGLDDSHGNKILKRFESMTDKSKLRYNNGKGYDYIFTGKSEDKNNVYLKFNEDTAELIEDLADNYVMFYISNFIELKKASSISLFVYLTSWGNPNYLENVRTIYKGDLHKVFNLAEGDYYRNYGSDQSKFDWNSFEKRVLRPAVNEIQKNKNCSIRFVEDAATGQCYKKIKKGRNIVGYEFKYVFTEIDKDGTRHIALDFDRWKED